MIYLKTNKKHRPLPPKAGYCWYISKFDAQFPKWASCVQQQTQDYFRVMTYNEGSVEGYLGRFEEEDFFFDSHRRGLSYFND
jgi:hypothetical protein